MPLILPGPDTTSLIFCRSVLLEISSKVQLFTVGKQRQQDQMFSVVLGQPRQRLLCPDKRETSYLAYQL